MNDIEQYALRDEPTARDRAALARLARPTPRPVAVAIPHHDPADGRLGWLHPDEVVGEDGSFAGDEAR